MARASSRPSACVQCRRQDIFFSLFFATTPPHISRKILMRTQNVSPATVLRGARLSLGEPFRGAAAATFDMMRTGFAPKSRPPMRGRATREPAKCSPRRACSSCALVRGHAARPSAGLRLPRLPPSAQYFHAPGRAVKANHWFTGRRVFSYRVVLLEMAAAPDAAKKPVTRHKVKMPRLPCHEIGGTSRQRARRLSRQAILITGLMTQPVKCLDHRALSRADGGAPMPEILKEKKRDTA